jgi:hypothetical protein
MFDLRNRQVRNRQSAKAASRSRTLLQSADASLGMSNLLTVPRAGNISSDTRAG